MIFCFLHVHRILPRLLDIKRKTMLKTIIRHGCRLRPAFNMRLSTTLNQRLHTLSPSSTYPNSQVRYLINLHMFFCLMIEYSFE